MNRRGLFKKFLPVFGVISLIVFIVVLFIYASRSKEDEILSDPVTDARYVVKPLQIPVKLDFAGESVPLSEFDVRENLDKELLINGYWQSHTLLLIKRANRYFPVIERILEENGIPGDFKYLAVAESDLMNLVSPADAVGFWQFRSGTARDYGLEVNEEVDERYHLEKSTAAACRFLTDSYEKYGSWTMAAASYNVGRAGLTSQVERQKSDGYYNLLLNEETGRYVYRILALKLILENPEEYGYVIAKEELYQPMEVYRVSVDTTIADFADFASRYSINYKQLKIFNPWLRDKKLSNKNHKTYHISLPGKSKR